MGFVYQAPPNEDDYSSEVIGLARDRSDLIREWLATEQYLLETPTPQETITPEWMRNRCVIKICEELVDMGIHPQIEFDTICDRPQLVYAVLMLRKKFDEENLRDLLQHHVEIRNDWNEIAVETDCIVDFIKRCAELLPTDEGWELLSTTCDEYPNMLENTAELTELITGLVNGMDDSSPSLAEEMDASCVVPYILMLQKRSTAIKNLADAFLKHLDSDNYDILKQKLEQTFASGFEIQLSTRDVIVKHAAEIDALDLTNDQKIKMFLETARQPFLKIWSHTLEHCVTEKTPDLPVLRLALMMATLLADAPEQSQKVNYVKEKLENLQDQFAPVLYSRIYDRFVDLISNTLNESISYAN